MEWLDYILKLWKRRPLRPYLFTIVMAVFMFFYVNSKHEEAMGEIRKQGNSQANAFEKLLSGIGHIDQRVDDLFKLLVNREGN